MIKNSIGDFYDFARSIVSGEARYGIGYLYRKGTALIEKGKQRQGFMRVVYNAAGFTLVELSIVLVIVGLLIGGILVAQSMIGTAKIQSQIRQFQQIDAAIGNFKTKFNQLPGDSKYHTVAGDGDGAVENSILNGGTKTLTLSRFDYEIANFWRHLQQDKFLVNEYGEFSNDASAGVRAGIHVPKAMLGNNTGIAPFYNNIDNQLQNPFLGYYLANFEGSTADNISAGGIGGVPSVHVSQMIALEAKLDDGVAYVSNFSIYSFGYMYTSSYTSSCYTGGGTHYQYNIASDANCILYLRMQSTTTRER